MEKLMELKKLAKNFIEEEDAVGVVEIILILLVLIGLVILFKEQLTDLVKNMMSKQAATFGQATDIWKFLAKGNYTVDAETKAKAQKDIADDGYWGVEQTSDRIVSFATALAGDDSSALEKMRNAFIKGYKQAEKQWGGKLPDISQRTYDAVMKKFDSLTSKKTEDTDKSTSTDDGKVVIKKDNTTTKETTDTEA